MDNKEEKNGLLLTEKDPTNADYIVISTHLLKIKKGMVESFIFRDKVDCDVTFHLSIATTEDKKPFVSFDLKDEANMNIIFQNINENKLVRNNNKINIGSYQKDKELFLNFAIYPLLDNVRNVIVEFYYKK